MPPRPLPIALLAAALAAPLLAPACAAGLVAVAQRNRAFSQADLAAPRSSTLHVTNDDQFTHQIYIDAPTLKFESPEQDPGTSVDIPLPTSGLFEVRCRIHPKMKMTLHVS